MACEYKSNGESNPLNTTIFQYIEDTRGNERDVEFIEQALLDAGVVIQGRDGLVLPIKNRKDIKHVNDTAEYFFGALAPLIKIEGFRITIVPEVLKSLYSGGQTSQSRGNRSDKTNRDLGEDFEVEYNEVFQLQEEKNTVTEKIVTNLQLQIDRLERLPDTEVKKANLTKLKRLRTELKQVKKGEDNVDTYLQVVQHIITTAAKARSLLDTVEVDYVKNAKSISTKERAALLRKISDLKVTIDSYYQDNPEKSLLNLIQDRLQGMEGPVKNRMILNIVDAIEDMKDVNKRYLDIAIPVQADYLMSFASLEINDQIDARIENIRATRRLSGLNRFDPRYKKANQLSKQLKSLDPLIELNIKQLEKLKIGRKQIIDELRTTHIEASWFSTYTDPLIYSSEKTIQLFALAVKDKLLEAHEATLDTVMLLKDEYKAFVDWKGVGELNASRLNEDITEVVTIYVKNKDGKYVPMRVNSLVQEYNISLFYETRNNAFNEYRQKYNYPEDATASERAEWLETEDGLDYRKAVAEWYKENTVPKPGAQKVVEDMMFKLKKLEEDLKKAKFENKPFKEIEELENEFYALTYEYDKVVNNGVIVGALTQPSENYRNPKFENMPAEAKQYYDLILDIYKADQDNLGGNGGGLYTNSWDNMSYILPGILKDAVEIAVEKGGKNAAQNLINEQFAYQETDTEFGEMLEANGEKIKTIPRYYTSLVEADKGSMDVTNSIIKFHDMANRYKYKAEITGVVSVMQAAIGGREILEMHESGNYIVNKTAQMLGFDFFEKTKDPKDSNTFKQLESFIDAVFYGKTFKGDAKNNMLFGLTNANKLASSASTITALSALSFNFLQTTNQFIMDSTVGSQESWAGQFYTRDDMSWARKQVYLAGAGLEALREGINPKFAKESKLSKMMQKFDALQKFERQFGEEAGGFIKKKLTMDSAFFAQNAVEFVTTAEKMLALSRSYKGKLKDKSGKVLLNDKGEEADLWDMLIEDSKGKLIVDPRVANFDERRFVFKLHGIMKRTNQLKGGTDITLAERTALGRMLILFRKYFNPGYRKRFGHSAGGLHVDMELGEITEGYYQTVFNYLSNAMYALKTEGWNSAFEKLKKGNLTKEERQNLARALHEQMIVLLTTITAMLIANISDDDEENTWTEGMIAYQALRLRTEFAAFLNPLEFIRIAQSPMAAVRPIQNLAELAVSTFELMFYPTGIVPEKEVFYQKKSGRFEKGDLKWVKDFTDVLPIVSGVFKSADPNEAAKFYDLF